MRVVLRAQCACHVHGVYHSSHLSCWPLCVWTSAACLCSDVMAYTHGLHMSYSCHTHVIFMSYTCHTRVIYMSATCHTSVAYTEYTVYKCTYRHTGNAQRIHREYTSHPNGLTYTCHTCYIQVTRKLLTCCMQASLEQSMDATHVWFGRLNCCSSTVMSMG